MRVLSLFCLLFSITTTAQNYLKELKPDIQSLIDQGEACLKAKKSDCNIAFEKALSLAEKEKDSTLAMTHYVIGLSHSRYGKLPVFLEYLNKGLSLTQGENHPTVTSAILRKKVYAFARMGPIDSILPTSEVAMKWAKESNDNQTIAEVYIQRADLLHRLGNSNEALQLLREAKPFADKANIQRQKAGIVFTMGNIYLSNYDFEEARATLEESMTISKGDDEMYYLSLVNWSLAMIALVQPQPVVEKLPEAVTFFKGRNLEWTAKTHLSHAHSKLENYKESIMLSEQCLAAAQQIYDPTLISLNNRILAKGYIETNQAGKAVSYAEKAYTYESEKGAIDEQVLGSLILYGFALGKSGQKDKAYDVWEHMPKLIDSVGFTVKQREIKKWQELYETEKKEAQIAIQEKNIALLEEKETSSKLQKGLLAAGLLAVLGVLSGLWVRFRESKKRAALEREKLDAEIQYKQKELTTHALHLAKKNEILVDLKSKVEQMEGGCETRDIINTINFDLKDEASWEHFTQYFEKVHTDFGVNVKNKYPDVTTNELRLMALLRMNLNNKEIANILNITADGVKKARYRLRKKMNLASDDSLETAVLKV